MNGHTLTLSLSILLVSFTLLQGTHASPTLNITVNTNKEAYHLGEMIQVYGNLTVDSSPIPDSLVALQVDNPIENMLILRTLSTGTIPSQNWSIEVLQVIPCDGTGVPKDSFKRGTMAYVNITVKNIESESRNAMITLNLYDSALNSLIAFPPYQGLINPGTISMIISVPIPSHASTGEAFVYVNAFTQEPGYGGVPWCPEKSASFIITSSSTSSISLLSQTIISEATEGTYNLSCRIPSIDMWLGNYTAYVTSEYGGEQTSDTVTFEIYLLGDAYKDGKVDGKDIALVISNFGLAEGDPDWNPNCDVRPDGKIDGKDIAITIREYGKTGIY